MNTFIIVQARMTSTRLPGKVLLPILGKPLLEYQIERLRRVRKANGMIIAVTINDTDQPIIDLCNRLNIQYYRGPEEDVLARYYGAAITYKANVIVRITADCPFIDPRLIDLIIDNYFKEQIDYAAIGIEGNFPRGLDAEIFSFETLEKANLEARRDYEREHVTPYIYEHPELFKIKYIEALNELRRPEIRLTVDTKEDLNLAREIFKNLYDKGRLFYTDDIIGFLDNHQELLSLNSHVRQKNT